MTNGATWRRHWCSLRLSCLPVLEVWSVMIHCHNHLTTPPETIFCPVWTIGPLRFTTLLPLRHCNGQNLSCIFLPPQAKSIECLGPRWWIASLCFCMCGEVLTRWWFLSHLVQFWPLVPELTLLVLSICFTALICWLYRLVHLCLFFDDKC